MKYVLDSCVAVKWFLAEPDSPKAMTVLDGFDQKIHELLAPDIFPVEVAHAITKTERRGLITTQEGTQAIADLMVFLPELHPYLPLVPRAYETHPKPGSACTTASTWPWPSENAANS